MRRFRRNTHTWAKRLKKLAATKNLRILLSVLSAALLITAGMVFLVQWREGDKAAQSARLLLDQNGIKPDAAHVPSPDPSATPSPFPSLPAETAVPAPQNLQGYDVIARLDIAKINLSLPVLSGATGNALKVSACRYLGTVPGAKGNFVITGHNYRNGAIFGRLENVDVGDNVLLTGTNGKTYAYTVYAVEHIRPNEADKLYDTAYDSELTLLTCENSDNGRLLIRCRPGD